MSVDIALLVVGLCVCAFAAGAWFYSIPLDSKLNKLEHEVADLRKSPICITHAEREAIEEAICDQESYIADCRNFHDPDGWNFHDPDGEKRAVQIGDALRGLLERTK